MNYKILHCADLHIDSPLRGLAAAQDAPVERLRTASRHAFNNLIDLAITESVSLVLIAGDIFDGDWQDWHTGQFFTAGLHRLADAGIPVVAISGNHDAASVVSKNLARAWPKGCTLLDHKKPQTIAFPHLDLAVHGQSFAHKAVTENLALRYPRPIEGQLNIGLLHTALEGSDLHAHYAPCTLRELRDFGYDYWALGHIHQRGVRSEAPWIVFPGNIQARHINEEGEKGATLITVQDRRITSVEHRTLDVVRWQRIDVDVTACADPDAVETALLEAAHTAVTAAAGRLLAARLRLTGASPAHDALLKDALMADRLRNVTLAGFTPGALWLERIDFATTPPGATRAPDPQTEPLLHLLDAPPSPTASEKLAAWNKDLLGKAPGLLELLPPDHPATLLSNGEVPPSLLEEARALLRARLAGS